MKFRKKPVEIEAVQWTGNIKEMTVFMKVSHVDCVSEEGNRGALLIDTLEGQMTANQGDWIIKGAGHFYPCKRAIFEASYEKVPTDDIRGD